MERNKKYLAFLREERCVACLYWCHCCMRCEAAHGPVNGMGSKGSDLGAVPLCREHHREQHRIGWPSFQFKYGFSRAETAAKHYAAFRLEMGDAS